MTTTPRQGSRPEPDRRRGHAVALLLVLDTVSSSFENGHLGGRP